MHVAEKSDPQDWSARLTAEVAATIRERRRALGLTVEQLADATEEVGYAISRRVLNNLESGRRGYLTVAEVFTLATVLKVPPLELIAPLTRGPVEILPGHKASAWEASDWIAGVTSRALRDSPMPPRFREWAAASQPYFLKHAYGLQANNVRIAEKQFMDTHSVEAARILDLERQELKRRRDELTSLGADVPDFFGWTPNWDALADQESATDDAGREVQ